MVRTTFLRLNTINHRAMLEASGATEVTFENGYYWLKYDNYYDIYEPIPQGEDILVNMYYAYSTAGPALNIIGDQSSDVVFNNLVEGFSTIDISGTKVHANKGPFVRSFTHGGGLLNINTGVVAEDSIVGDGGRVNIATGATAERTEVQSGGIMNVATGGVANDTTVDNGGTLATEVQAKLNNLLAKGGAILDLDAGTVLTGNIVIDNAANMGGGYDYSKIFKDEVTDAGSLTLVGGLNDKLKADSLVNNTADKKLNLTDGNYLLGNSASVAGWDKLTISDATVKLDGAIKMADAQKPINLTSTSELNLAGNSPLVTTIIGSLNNDGILNFHHDSDDADDITNIYGNYKAYDNAKMYIDVNTQTNKSDQMLVDGDVSGSTKVTIYKKGSGEASELIKFVDAPNDDVNTGAYFKVDHIYGEALDLTDQWKIVHQDNAWYVTSTSMAPVGSSDGYGTADGGTLDADMTADAVLPPNFPDVPTIVPTTPSNSNKPNFNKAYAETLAYMALPSIGLEQIKDLSRIVADKVSSSKIKCKRCGIAEHVYNGRPLQNAWIDMGQRKSEIEAPVEVDAKLNTVDMGFDVQSDLHNRLGVFASYRQGEYELSGKGRKYYAEKGSEFEIDSWMLGVYHRYDQGRIWTMSSIYGGIQDVELTTDTGVESDSKGMGFGASVEAGVVFEPRKRFTIEPSVRLSYSMLKYDDMKDDYGKRAKFDDINNLEAEVGVKFERTWLYGKLNMAKLYFKPSIIQNMGKGDVCIKGLPDVDGVKNQTLLRGEVGASVSMGNGWNGFGFVGHSHGSHYSATDFNIGVGYSW